jgi:hypothetical protein
VKACYDTHGHALLIIASTMRKQIESVCAKCGTPTEAGLILCKKCGAALGPTDPLIAPSQAEIVPRRIRKLLLWHWVVLALLITFFPILFHPWWAFPVTLAIFGFLVWLVWEKGASK